MKVAVVSHLPNHGGLVQFTHALIAGFIEADPRLTIDYFAHERLVRQGIGEIFGDEPRVSVVGINDPDAPDVGAVALGSEARWKRVVAWVSLRLDRHRNIHRVAQSLYWSARRAKHRVQGRQLAKHWYEVALVPDVVDRLSNYDVVYFPFPFYLEPASIQAPVVGTFHDLNYLYFPVSASLERNLNRQIAYWTKRVDGAVVSSDFVEHDLLTHFPGVSGRSSVVRAAPYSYAPLDESTRRAALARFGLRDREYLVYPANHSPHKNLYGLVRAADLLKRSGTLSYPVVITGFGTDGLGKGKWSTLGEIDKFLASSSLVLGEDVRGLGFVTDEEVDALTRSARLLVSASLYEAGCGPAMDAWQFGVPVAFSNIPSFLEQLDGLGVEAWTFDPRDPEDMARVISRALSEREESLAMAARSREAIKPYTWKRTAESYLMVFGRAIDHYRNGQSTRN